MTLNRRTFNALFGATAAGLAMPSIAKGAGNSTVVVIGGGAGGATAARYIAKDAKGAINVVLIEPKTHFTTCFFSNLYLGGLRSFESITHSYEKLAQEYGIRVVHAYATGVDRDKKQVRIDAGDPIPYDRLVISPGIDFNYDTTPGYNAADMDLAPSAWHGGEQTKLLKAKLDALEDGQNILMVTPPNPYRCPPGPYERVSMMAHVLKSKGFSKSRIVVLDPKPKFSKQGLFQAGWEQYYPGMVEWLGPDVHGGIGNIDAQAGIVETDFDDFAGDLLNVIPGQMAGKIAQLAGLTNESGFCEIDPTSMRSAVDQNIFVIGDSSIAGDMPKSGFSANSQAKVCAMHVRADLLDSKRFPAKYRNTCWSLIAVDDGVKVGASYGATDEKIGKTSSFISQAGEDAETRAATYRASVDWYAAITADMFG
ncbi:NAD(P)/FAD-dependent oxidoreductase [Maritalea porphyrae]|uniref:Cytochrome c n=1 Tax=Maritalea porphyrae TaxID=880732 RepID=A0ABQ5UNI5_9HYPH|nr:NAD(P)/FAD-dependent oxidoreductase [Maritalea porphyrae]GLQ15921.1 cytochrome c [Maritalea porphyrae]